jgi:fibronectin-binding autotransporter adhesin
MNCPQTAGRARRTFFATLVLAALGIFVLGQPATATDGTWIGVGGANAENWGDTTKWQDNDFDTIGDVANGVGATADLTNSQSTLTGNDTIFLSIPVTLGILNLGDQSGQYSFTIGSFGNTLTFDNGGSNAQLNVNANSIGDTIAAPIVLNSSLDISNASSNPLTITTAGTITSGGSAVTLSLLSGSAVLSGIISDGGGVAVSKSGSGTLTLSGANTYSNGTTLSGGTLALGVDSSFASGAINSSAVGKGTLTLTGGILRSSDTTARTIYNNVILNGAITLGDTSNFGTLNFSSGVTGNKLTVTGNTTLTLASAVTISNATVLNANLSIANPNSVAFTISGGISAGVPGTTLSLLSGDATISGPITDGDGTVAVSKSGTGTLTLSGTANGYSGGTTINSGTLAATGATNPLGTGPVTLGSLGGGNATLSLGAAVNTLGNNITVASGSGGTLTLSSLKTTGATASGTITLNGDLTVSSATSSGNTFTLSGIISGSGGLTKIGAGILTLSGSSANTYTGLTTVNVGELDLNKSSGNAIGGNLTIGDGTGTDTVKLLAANQIADTSDVTLNAAGTPIFNLNGFSETIDALNSTNTAAAVQLGTGTLTVGANDEATFSFAGVISGTGGLTKSGTGTLTLSGTVANTYTGLTTVSGGELDLGKTSGINAIGGNITIGDGTGTDTLKLLAANQIADTATVTMNNAGGVFDLNGNAETIGGLSGTSSGASITLGSGTLTINQTTTTSFAGVISGTGGLTKSGTGSLTLSGTNSYDGLTTVSAGILNIQNAAALGGTGTGTTVSGGATLQLQGGLTFDPEALTISGTGAAGQNGALVNVSGTNNYSGLLTLGAATTISSDGSGTLNLTNTGTITGPTFGLTLTGTGNGSISSIIGTTSGTLTKSGTGTWTLFGANTFTGTTTVSAGTLKLGAGGSLFSGNALTTSGTGIFDINGNTQTLGLVNNGSTNANAITNSGAAATLTIGNGSTGAGAYTGNMDIIWNQLGTSSAITGTFTNTGNLTLNANGAGTIGLSAVNNTGTITNSGTGTGTTTISGVIGANVTGVTENSANSTLILSGTNLYGGTTTLTLGTLRGVNPAATNVLNAFGTSTLNLNGGILQLRGNSAASGAQTNTATIVVANNVIVGGTTTIDVDQNTNRSGNTFQFNNLTIGANTLNITGANSYALSFAGTTTLTGDATFNPTTANLTLGGVVSGAFSLTKTGTGTLTLSAANLYSGGTLVSAGTLALGSNTAVGTGTLTLSDGSTLRSNNTTARTLTNSLSLSGSIILGDATNNGALTFNTGSGTLTGNTTLNTASAVTINEVISGNFSLTKSGASTLTLGGANLFTGGMFLNAGTLTLGNATALGPAASATLTFGASSTGKLQLNGNSITLVDLNTNATVGTPIIESGSGTAGTDTLTVNTVNTDTYAGVLQNGSTRKLALTKSGSGTLILSGANTYTGGTTITSGVLSARSNTALGTSGTANSLPVTLSGGILELNGSGLVLDNGLQITMSDGTTFRSNGSNTTNGSVNVSTAVGAQSVTLSTVNAADVFTIGNGTNDITGGNGSDDVIHLAGPGTILLSQISNYIGNWSLDSGTTLLQSDTTGKQLGATSAATLTLNGGTLRLSYAGTSSISFTGGAGNNVIVAANSTIINDRTQTSGNTFNTYTFGNLSIGSFTLNVNAGTNYTSSASITPAVIFGTTTLTGNPTFSISKGANTAGTMTLTLGALNDGGIARTITKSGDGTLTLGTNAISLVDGTAVNITSGLLNSNTASSLGSLANITLTLGASTTIFNVGASQTVGALNSTGTGAGSVTLSGNTLTIGSTNNLNSTFAGAIGVTGNVAGSLVKNGTGSLTLSGTNLYTGGTTLNTGTLNINSATALGTGAFTIAGGTIDNTSAGALTLTNAQAWNGDFAFTGTKDLTFSGAVTLGANRIVTVNGGNLTESGIISGTNFGITKAGVGILTLSGAAANTYSGLTTVSAGELDLGKSGTANAIGTGGLSISGGTVKYTGTSTDEIANTGAVTVNGATAVLDLGASHNDTVGTVTLDGGGSIIGTGTSTLTSTGSFEMKSGSVSAILGGSVALNKTTAGTVTLFGANTYTGLTTISAGVLNIQDASALGSTAAGTIVSDGAALQIQNSASVGTETLTLNGSGISGTGALRNIANNNAWNGAITLGSASTIGSDAGSIALAGTISNGGFLATFTGPGTIFASGAISGAGGLTKTGTGTLYLGLGDSAANTYTGLTTVSAGTLVLNKADGTNAIVGDGASNKAVNDILVNGGTLRWDQNNQLADSVTLSISSGTVNFNGKNETLYDLNNSGGTVIYGRGNVTITDPNWTAGTNIVNGNTTFGVLNVSGGTNFITGENDVTNGGPGVLTVGGGGLTFKGTASPNITINSDSGTAGKLVLAGDVTVDSTVTAGTASITSGGVGTNPGQLDLGGATRTFTVNNGSAVTDLSISAMIVNGGLTKAGAGLLNLYGANTYSDGTTVNAGTLQASSSGTFGASTGSLTVNTGGTVDLNGTSQNVGAVNGSGGTVLNNAFSPTSTLTAGNGGANGSYAGVLADGAGVLAFTKVGTGTQTLTGTNTYTGATNVNAGTLMVNGTGSLASGSAVTVASGATLGGSGSVLGSISVSGTLQGGNGTAGSSLTVGDMTMNSGSIIQLALGPTSGSNSILALTGTYSFQSDQQFAFTLAPNTQQIGTYTLITGVTSTVDTTQWTVTNPGFLPNTYSFIWDDPTNSIIFTTSTVPEPGTWAGAALAALAIGYTQRRRFVRRKS